MSFRVVGKVMRESEETLGRRLILLAIAEAAHDDGVAWISQEAIAHKSRLSRTHVAERITEMSRDGVLQVRKAQRGRRRINVYRLVLPGLDEPDYDKLPFVLDQPFTESELPTPPKGVTVSDPPVDGVGSTRLTVSDLPGSADPGGSIVRAREVLEPLVKPLGNRKAAPLARRDERPPPLTKIGGRNIGFDALADVCGVDPSGNRARQVAAALNGSKSVGVGIREQFWRQLRIVGHDFGGEDFERALAVAIRYAADRYRQAMPDAMLTPTALAKWWTDLRAVPSRPPPRRYGYGLSSREMLDNAGLTGSFEEEILDWMKGVTE